MSAGRTAARLITRLCAEPDACARSCPSAKLTVTCPSCFATSLSPPRTTATQKGNVRLSAAPASLRRAGTSKLTLVTNSLPSSEQPPLPLVIVATVSMASAAVPPGVRKRLTSPDWAGTPPAQLGTTHGRDRRGRDGEIDG